MNKKIWIVSLLAAAMLVAISFVSSAEMNNDVEKKESPLYRIRTIRAISEKISRIIENIKTKFLGERIFFLPLQWLRNREKQPIRCVTEEATKWCFTCSEHGHTCYLCETIVCTSVLPC